MRCFEIHTCKNGVWHIDSVFDDSGDALFEAKRVEEGRRYAMIRVVEETYDETTNKTATRTIFRGGQIAAQDKARRDERAGRNTVTAAPRGAAGREPAHGGDPAPAVEKSLGRVAQVALSLFIFVGGAVAILGVLYLNRPR